MGDGDDRINRQIVSEPSHRAERQHHPRRRFQRPQPSSTTSPSTTRSPRPFPSLSTCVQAPATSKSITSAASSPRPAAPAPFAPTASTVPANAAKWLRRHRAPAGSFSGDVKASHRLRLHPHQRLQRRASLPAPVPAILKPTAASQARRKPFKRLRLRPHEPHAQTLTSSLQASTGSGTIRVHFPNAPQQNDENRHHLTGAINGGGPALEARTGSGDIEINSGYNPRS